jgi:hypothetical protein
MMNGRKSRKNEAAIGYDSDRGFRCPLGGELAQKNPDVYLPKVADTLNNVGILEDQNRMEEARKELVEALTIYESFAKNNPERFSADVTRWATCIISLMATRADWRQYTVSSSNHLLDTGGYSAPVRPNSRHQVL